MFLCAVLTPLPPRLQVRKLQTPRFVAAMPVRTDEGATSLVPGPHLAADGRRDRPNPIGELGLARAGGLRDRGLLLEDLGQERVERSLDDGSRVAVGDLVGEQILQLLEFSVGVFAQGDLEFVATGREGRRIG